MGQKVHPYGFRLGFNKPWRSRWFAKQDYARLLQEDVELRATLRKRLKSAGVSSIEVDRPGNKLRVTIRTSRPGIIIGRKGAEIEKLRVDLAKRTKRDVFIDIQEVLKPELDAQLVSESIALQLEKRVAFRRAMRKAVDSALRFGCKGIKVRVSGRLNGAEIARSEWYLQGRLPLHTLRADIDYGFSEAHTTYGVIGVKAWLYKGEILDTSDRMRSLSSEPEPWRDRPERGDRRDRGGDRGDRRPPTARHHEALAPAAEPSGPAGQAPPPEMAHPARSGGPIVPPLMEPYPHWKQEARSEMESAPPTPAPQQPSRQEASAEAAKPTVEADPANVPKSLDLDSVHFSVTAPAVAVPATSFELRFWAHLDSQRDRVLERATQGFGVRHRPGFVFISEGPFQLERGVRLSVRVAIKGLEVNPPHKIVLWVGDIGSASFTVSVPPDLTEGTHVGTVSIRLNGSRIATMDFVLNVGKMAHALDILPATVRPHKSAFASYAREDRDQVIALVQGMQTAMKGLNVFVDVVKLRSGQDWEQELRKEIQQADVFYLFWCRHAKQSMWVEKEWRCALDWRGAGFIDPVPLESPDYAMPPPELAAKHFNDPLLAYASTAGHGVL